jgi:hypothetical protein
MTVIRERPEIRELFVKYSLDKKFISPLDLCNFLHTGTTNNDSQRDTEGGIEGWRDGGMKGRDEGREGRDGRRLWIAVSFTLVEQGETEVTVAVCQRIISRFSDTCRKERLLGSEVCGNQFRIIKLILKSQKKRT